jgi:hypothetical protein
VRKFFLLGAVAIFLALFSIAGGVDARLSFSTRVIFSDFAIDVSGQGDNLTVSRPLRPFGSLKVSANGKFLGEVKSGSEFTLAGLSNEEAPEIVFEYEREAVPSDFQGLSSKSELLQAFKEGVPLTYTEIEALPGATMNSASIDAANAAVLPDKTYLRYQTFIPYAYVGAPAYVCTYKSTVNEAGFLLFGPAFALIPQEFNGNNRSWDASAINNSKTSFTVGIDWLSNGKLATDRRVGETRLYANFLGTRTLVARDRASTSGMDLLPQTLTSSYVKFEMKQDVANPLCAVGLTLGITYDYHFDVRRTGAYSIYGVSVAAPNHELYYLDDTTSQWSTVMKRTVNSFECFAFYMSNDPNCKDTGSYVQAPLN